MYRVMKNRHLARRNSEAVPALEPSRMLLPGLPLPVRYFLGLGLMFLCLWLPAFASLFRR